MEQNEFTIMAVIKGAHYELVPEMDTHTFITYEDAYAQMLLFKDQCNAKTSLKTAKIEETRDVIRTDTIEKMYIKVVQK